MKAKDLRKAEEWTGGTEDLDPRLKLLNVDMNALILWEETAGRPFSEIKADSMRDFRLLVWAGLKTQIPDITLEQVGSMITVKNTETLTALISEKTGIDIRSITL